MARSQSAWIEFGGHKSTELHAYLTEFPTRPRGAERGEWAEILGKSGALWVPGDAYDLMEIKCSLLATDQANEITLRHWLSGAGNLVFSDDDDYALKARVVKGPEIKKLGATKMLQITVTFACQPFRYLSNPSNLSVTGAQTIQNPGSYFSDPVIQVSGSGSGTLKINNIETEISDLTGGVVIDSEARLAYNTGADVNLSGRISGEWPVFEVGNNAISFSGGITGLIVAPNWRWV